VVIVTFFKNALEEVKKHIDFNNIQWDQIGHLQ